jgi:hypothetical protein
MFPKYMAELKKEVAIDTPPELHKNGKIEKH